MFRIEREQLLQIIRRVDQAVYNHNQWYQELIRAIVCRLPFDARDLGGDAHIHCPFGQWYYHCPEAELLQDKTFQAIRSEHERAHDEARGLLLTASRNETISAEAYDSFAESVERLRIHLHALQYELEETMYNLDPLTGVRNRVGMLNDLHKQMDLIDRNVETTSIAILDVDKFKNVNDRYGHLVGDKILASIASYILQHLRPYDSIYRYGGEEFLLMMPHTDVRTAHAVCERIRIGIAGDPHEQKNGEAIAVTVSVGLTQLQPNLNVETAMERADEALYQAKSGGRNQSVVLL